MEQLKLIEQEVTPTVIDLTNKVMTEQASSLQKRVETTGVANDSEFINAAELLVEMYRYRKNVEGVYKPLKEEAHKEHKALCSEEKSHLTGVGDAEKHLENKILRFIGNRIKQRALMEANAQTTLSMETAKKMEEAEKLEASGDIFAAELLLQECFLEESINTSFGLNLMPDVPKVKGVTVKKEWMVANVDSNLVPVSVSGAIIRPVDEKTLLKMKKANSTFEVEGVQFEEVLQLSVRGGT